MTDVVALGSSITTVLPLAIQSYRAIYEGTKRARKYVHELNYLEKDLMTQRCIFLNECQLLLRHAGGDETLWRTMVDDPSHLAWKAETLEKGLKTQLDDSYDDCAGIIERIHRKQGEAIKELEIFEVMKKQKTEVRRMYHYHADTN